MFGVVDLERDQVDAGVGLQRQSLQRPVDATLTMVSRRSDTQVPDEPSLEGASGASRGSGEVLGAAPCAA